MTSMTKGEMLERAQAIRGRYPLGLVGVTDRAYASLGGVQCLSILQQYADELGPRAEEIPGEAYIWPMPVHEVHYHVGAEEYVVLTETHLRSGHDIVTTLCHVDEEWA
jgi:hypothetical protein